MHRRCDSGVRIREYSRLTATDEERTIARLRGLRTDLIDPAISVHHGRVVKRTGDGTLIEFRSVVDAVRCAIEVQNGMVERNAGLPPERQILFRVGIHLGDVIEEADGDLMGDGVNIAARLENICEPGAICLSEHAYLQVKSRLDLAVSDLGAKDLKNIPEPVHVYSLEVGKPARAKPVVTVAPLVAPPPTKKRLARVPQLAGIAALIIIAAVAAWYFLMRPGGNLAANAPAHLSIVVLPFANLSNDPKQDYFADGITDNLTTDLSRIRNSFVIARNTAFTYKGKAADAKEIGKELGVRYVLEGSVQRDGKRVRVNAQLIDAESGSHLWADRFEEDLADLFKLQDDVVARLANALGYELINAEAARAAHAVNPDAIDLTMQGWALMRRQSTKDNNKAARALFNRALNIDPNDSDALAGLAYTYGRSYDYGWDDSPVDYDAKVIGLTDRAIALNPANASAYSAKATYLSQTKRPAEALATAEAGLEHTPNIARLYFARAFSEMSLGRYEQSRSDLLQAIRLSPRDPLLNLYHTLLAGVELLLGHDEATIQYARKAIEEEYRGWYVYAYLAASYAFLGKDQEASAALADARRVNPALTIKWAMAHSADGPRFFEGLRKAGLPEDEPPKHLSIVVLPFENLSGDPKQDYFADGITDDLTTDLSRIRNSFVIARNTAFTYKGKAVDAKEIGKDLGVRYVLEGSVARDGNRVRVNVQLIDAESGTHLWADRFGEDLADLFKLQDDVVARLSRTLQVELVDAEAQRGLRDRPQNPDSIDLTMQGWSWVNRTATAENFGAARAAFKKALMLDDANVDALVGFAFVSGRGYAYAWPGWPADAYEQGRQAIDRAITLDPSAANAYFVKSNLLMWKMAGTADANEVLDVAATALRLNPGLAGAYYTMSGAEEALGKCADGKSHLQEAIKISPRDPDLGRWRMALSRIDFCLRRYDDAVQEARRALDTGFRTTVSYIILAAACQADGRSDDAKRAVADALKLMPGLSVAWFHNHIPSFLVDPPGFLEAVRKAGLPEDEEPRLSIVVLPFQNLSGDEKQDYLADVLTDELTTYISRIPGSFVIARNTAFTYKGKPTDAKEIGKDLGVRYALEGSVQWTDKRIRTNAQLIDTETGAHLWAEEFDTDKTDLLQTEDEIVTRLARSLDVTLTAVEAAKGARVHPANPDAQDLALQCLANFNANVTIYDPEKIDQLDAPCEGALKIDPRNLLALRLLATRYAQKVYRSVSSNPKRDIARAEDLIERAFAVDPNDAETHAAEAGVLFNQRRMEEAVAEAQKAIELNPSDMFAYFLLCGAENGAGKAGRAIADADKAIRLSPRDPVLFLFFFQKGWGYNTLKRFDDAITWYEKALALAPNSVTTLLDLTVLYARTGRVREAHEMYLRATAIPGMQIKTIAQLRAVLALVVPASDPDAKAERERRVQAMRLAGMPEQ